jgi:hypothetical protein
MTSHQYRAALSRLGLTQAEAAEFLGVSTRMSNAYANGAWIPVSIAKLLRLMVKHGIAPNKLED